ncbi:MAG: hypothetical protein WCR28_01950 [Candidatus Izemoplasmatales bacterium]|jgi:hypothetical protein
MKRLFVFVFTVALFVAFGSCREESTGTDTFTTTITTEDTSTFITISPQIEDDARPANGIVEDYYVDDAINLDILDHLSLYAESDIASDAFIELYNNADDISIIPVYGKNLEYTSLVVCLFSDDDVLLGTKTIHVFEEEGEVQITEFTVIIGDTSNHNPLSDRQCFLKISSCQADYPTFQLLGVVYYAIGYQTIYPIGIPDGENYIKFYYYGLSAFGWVDPFSTVEEGRDKYDIYWITRTAIIKSIPTFPWKTKVLHSQGWINKYKHQDIFTMGETRVDNLYDYETVIAIPLLDENGQEYCYVLHLLYIQNYLIGEVILKKQEDGVSTSVSAIYAEKTTTGGYIPLEGINYVAAVEELLVGVDETQVVGIGFDGSEYSLIFVDTGS